MLTKTIEQFATVEKSSLCGIAPFGMAVQCTYVTNEIDSHKINFIVLFTLSCEEKSNF